MKVSFCSDYTFCVLCSQEEDMQSLEKHVNFENENSRKAYYREFKKVRNHLRHFTSWCSIQGRFVWIHTDTELSRFVQSIFF